MGKVMKLCLISLVSWFCLALGCDRCVYQSKLAYDSHSGSINGGACGYGKFASNAFLGKVAAAASNIYRDGVGCGACYQIRCKNPALCKTGGAQVSVTDFNKSNQTDFVVSSSIFSSLAVSGKEIQLLKEEVVDIEYKRIPCDYGSENMKVRVDESSKYPSYLAVQFLKQGGQTDIVAADVAQVGSQAWHFLSRKYGAVWDVKNPPKGELQFRFVVTSGYDGKWVWAKKTVLPFNWKAGRVYDTGVQISDVAQEGCYPCNDTQWS